MGSEGCVGLETDVVAYRDSERGENSIRLANRRGIMLQKKEYLELRKKTAHEVTLSQDPQAAV